MLKKKYDILVLILGSLKKARPDSARYRVDVFIREWLWQTIDLEPRETYLIGHIQLLG